MRARSRRTREALEARGRTSWCDTRARPFDALGRERRRTQVRRQVAMVRLERVERAHELDGPDAALEEVAEGRGERCAAEDLGRERVLSKDRTLDSLTERRAAPAPVLVLIGAHP